VTAVPQLIWLSGHKPPVFGVAGALLAISGVALWVALINQTRVAPPITFDNNFILSAPF
jgi:hypothetical protein